MPPTFSPDPSPAALQERRDRFIYFAFAAADLMAEIGPERGITFAAGAFRDRFGEDGAAFQGRRVECLFAPEDRHGLEIALSQLASRGRLSPVTLRLANAARDTVSLAGLHLPTHPSASWITLSRLPAAPTEAACVAAGPLFQEAVANRIRAAEPGGIGLIEVGGWSRLAPERRRALESTIAEALRSAGGSGAVAAEMEDGRFGVVGGPAMNIADLQQSIGAILRAAGAARTVCGTAIPLGADADVSTADAVRAMRYAVTVFTTGGVAGVRRAGFDKGLRGFLTQAEARAGAMRGAIERGRFRLVYQPVVSLDDRATHHFEALIRPFPIEGHDSASTQEFVTFAEAMGLAEALDAAVLERTLAALREAPARVAVNVSGLSMQSPRFREKLLGIIALEPEICRRLMVELTETADIEDVAAAVDTVNRLAAAGVPVCLDDFGAGFAAFRYLREFKVDFVKIDGSFVRNAGAGARESGFISAMTDLARCVGAATIAEMIETEAEAEAMRKLGVEFGQGYLFGRPGGLPGSV